MGKWPTGARWYVFALTYWAAINLSAALVDRLITGMWPPFGQEPLYLMAAGVLVSTPAQAGEEIGWRGYALPRLTSRFGLAGASIILGVIWGLRHLPFFLLPGTEKTGQAIPLYVAGTTALSVAMAWLYWRTNGSLLITMLMHSAINNTTGILALAVPSAANPWTLHSSLASGLTVALLWISVLYFLVRMRSVRLLA